VDRRQAAHLLGVATDARPAEVEHAFRAAARRSHPDLGGHPGAFRAATEARTVMLSTPVPPVGIDRVVDLVARYHPVILLAEAVARSLDRHLARAEPVGDRRP